MTAETRTHEHSDGIPTTARVILDLVNTIDVEDETDSLTTRGELTDFLYTKGLLVRRTPSTDGDVALARRLRTGLREAMELNPDHRQRHLPELDATLVDLPLRLSWGAGEPELVATSSGVPGALTQIAIAVTQTVRDDAWSRLRICSDDRCASAYYDTSKNRSKNWCGLSCSNRAKTRAYRARKKAAAQ